MLVKFWFSVSLLAHLSHAGPQSQSENLASNLDKEAVEGQLTKTLPAGSSTRSHAEETSLFSSPPLLPSRALFFDVGSDYDTNLNVDYPLPIGLNSPEDGQTEKNPKKYLPTSLPSINLVNDEESKYKNEFKEGSSPLEDSSAVGSVKEEVVPKTVVKRAKDFESDEASVLGAFAGLAPPSTSGRSMSRFNDFNQRTRQRQPSFISRTPTAGGSSRTGSRNNRLPEENKMFQEDTRFSENTGRFPDNTRRFSDVDNRRNFNFGETPRIIHQFQPNIDIGFDRRPAFNTINDPTVGHSIFVNTNPNNIPLGSGFVGGDSSILIHRGHIDRERPFFFDINERPRDPLIGNTNRVVSSKFGPAFTTIHGTDGNPDVVIPHPFDGSGPRPDASFTYNPDFKQQVFPQNPYFSNLGTNQFSNTKQPLSPLNQPQYSTNQPQYPTNQQQFPTNQQQFPTNQQQFPINQQQFPTNQQQFPTNQQFPAVFQVPANNLNRPASPLLVAANAQRPSFITPTQRPPDQFNFFHQLRPGRPSRFNSDEDLKPSASSNHNTFSNQIPSYQQSSQNTFSDSTNNRRYPDLGNQRPSTSQDFSTQQFGITHHSSQDSFKQPFQPQDSFKQPFRPQESFKQPFDLNENLNESIPMATQ